MYICIYRVKWSTRGGVYCCVSDPASTEMSQRCSSSHSRLRRGARLLRHAAARRLNPQTILYTSN